MQSNIIAGCAYHQRVDAPDQLPVVGVHVPLREPAIGKRKVNGDRLAGSEGASTEAAQLPIRGLPTCLWCTQIQLRHLDGSHATHVGERERNTPSGHEQRTKAERGVREAMAKRKRWFTAFASYQRYPVSIRSE